LWNFGYGNIDHSGSTMINQELNHIIQSLNELSPEQMRELRRELDGKIAAAATNPTAGSDLGSIEAMRDDAELLDQAVAHAMKVREGRPWRLSPGE
jgi:alkylation response protein AidB-like acyl-CoA dehydrogenase